MSPEIDKDINIIDLGIKKVNFGKKKFADDPIVAPPQKRMNSNPTSTRKNGGGGGGGGGGGMSSARPRQRLTDMTVKAYQGIYIYIYIYIYICVCGYLLSFQM